MDALPLSDRVIAVPETRELDLFAQMLEGRGATTVRCPLIAIRDTPDTAAVEAWLERFNTGQMNDLILLTGEGLRRLLDFAERAGIKEILIARLAKVRKITRGPKPERALRHIGLRSDLSAVSPTTEGVIASLSALDLQRRRIGVQLYGSEPNLPLIHFLKQAGATPDPIAPYVYASQSEDRQIGALIQRLAQGEIDVIAFTSSPQVLYLWQVAERRQLTAELQTGLERVRVAAVGPVVAEALRKRGVRVDMVPTENFFMKPLVNAITAALALER